MTKSYWFVTDDDVGPTKLKAKTLSEAEEEIDGIIQSFNTDDFENYESTIWNVSIYHAESREDCNDDTLVREDEYVEFPEPPFCVNEEGQIHQWRSIGKERRQCPVCGAIEEETYDGTNYENGTGGYHLISYDISECEGWNMLHREIDIFPKSSDSVEDRVQKELERIIEERTDDGTEEHNWLYREWSVRVDDFDDSDVYISCVAETIDNYYTEKLYLDFQIDND